MTTAAELVAEARGLIHGRTRPVRNKLATTVTSGTATVVCTSDITNIGVGSMICIGIERMYVHARDTATRTLSVYRGEDGSTAAAHTEGDTIWVNARVDDFSIFREMNNGLRSFSADGTLYKKGTPIEITYDSSKTGFNLTNVTASKFRGVLEVRHQPRDGRKNWVLLKGCEWSKDESTTDFASGVALFVKSQAPEAGATMRVKYKAAYEPLATLADNVETVTGLHESAHRLLPLYAAWQLIANDEVRRNDPGPQADSRRPEDVASGAILRSAAGIKAKFDDAFAAEKTRLATEYPSRI